MTARQGSPSGALRAALTRRHRRPHLSDNAPLFGQVKDGEATAKRARVARSFTCPNRKSKLEQAFGEGIAITKAIRDKKDRLVTHLSAVFKPRAAISYNTPVSSAKACNSPPILPFKAA
jgi:hypothetical protein